VSIPNAYPAGQWAKIFDSTDAQWRTADTPATSESKEKGMYCEGYGVLIYVKGPEQVCGIS
jgi:hypothetical protein